MRDFEYTLTITPTNKVRDILTGFQTREIAYAVAKRIAANMRSRYKSRVNYRGDRFPRTQPPPRGHQWVRTGNLMRSITALPAEKRGNTYSAAIVASAMDTMRKGKPVQYAGIVDAKTGFMGIGESDRKEARIVIDRILARRAK